jgi:geranylgeranyl diphosphate synthase, type II
MSKKYLMQNDIFKMQLNKKAKFIDGLLLRLLAEQTEIDRDLRKAIQYTLKTPGKRVRPALVLWCCEVVSGKISRDAQIAAAAIEMVHTYSLIHDDLPAMDDDDLRRGRPTCHVAFDEATAILAGDGLLTLAFEILAKEISDPAMAVKLIYQLSLAAGPSGMVAGQMADLKAEMTKGTKKLIEYIHINKTAKMFRAAAAMGAICGRAGKKQFDCLSEYGLKIGLGFQIADDILDVSGSSERLGKTAGKDAKAGKATYPSVFGMKKSMQLSERLADEAIACLKSFGAKTDILRQLALALFQRTK